MRPLRVETLEALIAQVSTASGDLPQYRCPRCHARLFDGWLFGVIVCRACGKTLDLTKQTKKPTVIAPYTEAG
jgi:uncharacterized protein (DUF983 family)